MLYELKDKIAWITINLPEKRNAINRAMLEELYQALCQVRGSCEVWVAVVSGAVRDFSIAHDLYEADVPEAWGGVSMQFPGHLNPNFRNNMSHNVRKSPPVAKWLTPSVML